MNIFDAIPKTTYTEQHKDFIFDFISTNFADEKYDKIFLIEKKFPSDKQEEQIFLIEKLIEMKGEQNGSKYLKVSKILIYLIKDFPNEPPKIFLEKAHKHTIVPMQKNVSKLTYEIKVQALRTWKNEMNWGKIIQEIKDSFVEIYPLCLEEISKRPYLTYPEESQLPIIAQKVFLGEIKKEQNQLIDYSNIQGNLNPNSANNFSNPSNENRRFSNDLNNNQEKYDICNRIGLINKHKNDFTENEIKKILLENTIKTLRPKITEEVNDFYKTRNNLENTQNSLNTNITNLKNKIEQGRKILIAFENEIKSLDNSKLELKKEIIKDSNVKMNFENYENFVEISEKEKKILKLISLEITLEDFVNCIKLNYSYGKMPYENCSRLMREISKEIFKINYYKEKLQGNLEN